MMFLMKFRDSGTSAAGSDVDMAGAGEKGRRL